VSAPVLLLGLLLCFYPPEPAGAPVRAPDEPTRAMQAARYAPGIMQRVARRRGMPFDQCGIALDHASLGSRVRVQGVRTGVALDCTVYDRSHPRDLARHARAQQVELDHDSARAICGRRWFRSRPKECPVLVTVLGRGE
jgi:hypothetical protein